MLAFLALFTIISTSVFISDRSLVHRVILYIVRLYKKITTKMNDLTAMLIYISILLLVKPKKVAYKLTHNFMTTLKFVNPCPGYQEKGAVGGFPPSKTFVTQRPPEHRVLSAWYKTSVGRCHNYILNCLPKILLLSGTCVCL